MRGNPRGPAGGDTSPPEVRRLTPSIGSFEKGVPPHKAREANPPPSQKPESDAPSDTANEDFLFHLYRGSELLQDNRVHEAKEELEQALHLQPRDTKGQDLLAVVYFRLGLYPRAIAIYEQLRRKNPRDTALLLNLALCYLKTGQPALARRDLEQLLQVNPAHARAWGYLGLACERLGDLGQAERAFDQGGHSQMAKRMAERRATAQTSITPSSDEDSVRGRDMRAVVAAAFEELDTGGDLNFEVAKPISDNTDAMAAPSWRPVELGRVDTPPKAAGESTSGTPLLPLSRDGTSRPPGAPEEVRKSPPKEAPPVIPHIGPPASIDRRPTLIAPAPPAANANTDGLLELASPQPPTFALDEAGVPSVRRPVVAVPPVRSMSGTQAAHGREPVTRSPQGSAGAIRPLADVAATTRHAAGSAGDAMAHTVREGSIRRVETPSAPPPVGQLTRESFVPFPPPGTTTLHGGVAFARTTRSGFVARLESIRVSSNGVPMRMLERQARGKSTGESFGGVGSPMVHIAGEAQLVLGARPGRKLSPFGLDDDMCFVREEVLLGFDGSIGYENGRLATGEGEFVAVVQLRGTGSILLEALGPVLTLEVRGNRGMSVRREVILGWFGRLVPRALATNEAPCGQRGLVSFAGEGRVLVAST
jgi:uncharacterized protein (AIM24 family)/DNA-binding SARP family transcriptional activator